MFGELRESSNRRFDTPTPYFARVYIFLADQHHTSTINAEATPTTMNKNNLGCPCCAIDLFLPPSYKEDNDGVDYEENDETAQLAKEDPTANDDGPCSPQEAIDSLVSSLTNTKNGGDENKSNKRPTLVLVDTHHHAQLDRGRDEAYDIASDDVNIAKEAEIRLISLTCAVEPADWKATLEFASSSKDTLPGLGVHPWYLADLPDNWLQELEDLLISHPSSFVGEIGLCKMARFVRQHPEGKTKALEIQRAVFKQQMILAAKLRRPVSVHCVNQHGVFISVLEELLELASSKDDSPLHSFPVAIGMHSFTGTAHQVKQLLNFETKVQSRGAKKKKKQPAPADPLFYFGFSHTVNHVMCTSEKSRKKGREAVRSIPENRLLAESDVHSSHDLCGGTAGAVAYIAWARDASLQEIANVTAKNGLAFLRRAVDLDD